MKAMVEEIEHELIYAFERSEINYWSKYYTKQSPVKCYANVIGGAFAGAVPGVDILALNRVIGLGLNGKIEARAIDDIIDFYKMAGSKRFFIQLSPFLKEPHTELMLLSKGFQLRNRWAKLFRPLDARVPAVASGLKVVEVKQWQARQYAEIIYNCFDWKDEGLVDWLAQTVGMPGYWHYFATYHGIPVAAAALHISGKYASMTFAGTLKEYRGLGAQGVLLKTRINDARRAGCTYIFSETGEDTPEKPVASYRNMRRIGFEEAYMRKNWIFEC